MPAMLLRSADKDAAFDLIARCGDLSDIEVFNNHVLVAIYARGKGAEEVTKGGIIVPNVSVASDDYESKVGVIIKIGPAAFKDEKGWWFRGQDDMCVGDWIVFRPTDGWSLTLLSEGEDGKKVEQLCRLTEDTQIRMRVRGPSSATRVY